MRVSSQTPPQSQKYEMPSPVSRVVGRLDLTASHRTFLRARSSLSPPVCIRSFTGSGSLVAFQHFCEMGSSSYFTNATAPNLIAPATDQYHFTPSLERYSHMYCSGAINRINMFIAVLSNLASHPADQPITRSWP